MYGLANNEIKGVSAILEEFKKTDFTQQLADAEAKIDDNRNLKIEAKKEKTSAGNRLKTLEKRITKNEDKLVQIGQVNEDIDALSSNYTKQEDIKRTIEERLKRDEQTSKNNKVILAETSKKLTKLGDTNEISEGTRKYLEAITPLYRMQKEPKQILKQIK